MPITVDLPDKNLSIDFPDDMPIDDINAFIQREYYPDPSFRDRIAEAFSGAEPLEPMREFAGDTDRGPLRPQDWTQEEEEEFKDWYGSWAEETGINADPDDPQHFYDYRGAFRADAFPVPDEKGTYHWPSEFKLSGHPDRYVGGHDTITGEPSPAQAEALSTGIFEGPAKRVITHEDVKGAIDYVTEMARRQQEGPQIAQAPIEAKPKGWVAQQVREMREKASQLTPEDRAQAVMDLMELEPVDRRLRYIERLGDDIISGALGVGEGFVGSMEWLLNSEIAKEIADLGGELQKNLAPEDPNYIDQLAMGAGSMATFFIPGFGVMSATMRLGQGSKAAATMARWLGLSTSTVLESMTEAGHSYRQILEATKSKEKAEKGARLSFLLNTALIGFTNRLGIFGETGRFTRKAIVSSLMEGSQEGGQEIISAVAEGRPVNWKEVGTAASIGAILGPMFGMGELVTERVAAKRMGVEREVAKKEAGAPPAGKPEEAVPEEMGAKLVPPAEELEEAPPEGEPEVEYEEYEGAPRAPFATKAEAAAWGVTAAPEEIEQVRLDREDRLERAKILQEAGQTQAAMEEIRQSLILKEAIDAAEEPERLDKTLREHTVWHGSPREFETFKTQAIGTGEGAQAFGWGLYFTDVQEIARHYAEQGRYPGQYKVGNLTLDQDDVYGSYPERVSFWLEELAKSETKEVPHDLRADFEEEIAVWEDTIETRLAAGTPLDNANIQYMQAQLERIKKVYQQIQETGGNVVLEGGGRVYKVTLHKGKKPEDYEYLDWYEPVFQDTLEKVRKQAKKEGGSFAKEVARVLTPDMSPTGRFLYEWLTDTYRDSLVKDKGMRWEEIPAVANPRQEVSMFLLRAGVDGIRYPTETLTRRKKGKPGEKAYNYVIFDENAATIEETLLREGAESLLPKEGPEYSIGRDYNEALQGSAQNTNLFIDPKKGRTKTALVQIATIATRREGETYVAEDYFNKLYAKRGGYWRPVDFWEVPEWLVVAANTFDDAAAVVVRNPETAAEQMNARGFDTILFSAMDVNKEVIKRIAQNFKGRVIVGGYVDPAYFKGVSNIEFHESLESAAKALGYEYKFGYDQRHFQGTRTIPRLCMSTGCAHKCAFCVVPKKVEAMPQASIDEQVEQFKGMKFKLVYLDDKTFGQAPNANYLASIADRIRKFNPDFQGFIIQTTAPAFLKLDPDFLKQVGVRFVELGMESYNDDILARINKPHRTKQLDAAVQKIRDLGMGFVPNVLVGLAGKEKSGKFWSETPQTYGRTLDFLKKNDDIISHVNVYNLALYEGTELASQIESADERDLDENLVVRSYLTNPEIHEKFYRDVLDFAKAQLDKEIPARIPVAETANAEIRAITEKQQQEELPKLKPKSVTDYVKEQFKTLGVGINEEWTEPVYTFKGKEAGSTLRIAQMAQIARNPLYEVSHVIYVKAGKVVSHEAVSARKAGITEAFIDEDWPSFGIRAKEIIKKTGADSVYLLHNHPSGVTKPSDEDIVATSRAFRFVKEFKGHVIINSGTYSTIEKSPTEPGSLRIRTFRLPEAEQRGWEDKLLKPSRPHPLLGEKIAGKEARKQVVALGLSLFEPPNTVAFFYTTSQGTVRALQVTPYTTLEDFYANEVADVLREQAATFGSSRVVAYISPQVANTLSMKGRTTLEKLVKDRVIYDAIQADERYIARSTAQMVGITAKSEEMARGLEMGERVSAKRVLFEEKKEQIGLFKKKRAPKAKLVPTEKAPLEGERLTEHLKALEKSGVGVGRGPFAKPFLVSVGKTTGTIYGPARKSDTARKRTVKRLYGMRTVTEHFRTVDGIKYLVMDRPILPKTKKLRIQKLTELVEQYKHEAPWYENWNQFMGHWEGVIPKNEIERVKKIQAIVSKAASPQGAQTITGAVVKRLEKKGVVRGGNGLGISKDDAKKINFVWKGQDKGKFKELADYQQFYGDKIGAMVYSMLYPRAQDENVVIDRHMPRLWGYNIMWGGFRVSKALRRQIVDDVLEVSKQMDIPPAGIQAALWFATGAGYTGTATHFEEAIQAAPKKSLGRAMFTALTAEPQQMVHFGKGLYYMIRGADRPAKLTAAENKELNALQQRTETMDLFGRPLDDGQERRLEELTHKKEGDQPRPWSRNSVQAHMDAHTEQNPYIPLGHWYPGATRRESFFWDAEPHLTTIYQDEIYDLVDDKLDYRIVALERAKTDPEVKAGKRTVQQIYPNALANVIYETGDFKGFRGKIGEHTDVIYTFDEVPVEEHPVEATLGVSDMVNTAIELPTDLDEVKAVVPRLASNFHQYLQGAIKDYPITISKYYPTLAKAGAATANNVEYGLMADVKGNLSAIRAALSDTVGVRRGQRNVILMHSEYAPNGVRVRFQFKEKDLGKIGRSLRKAQLPDYVLRHDGANYHFDYFVPSNAMEEEALKDRLDTLYKSAGKEGTLEHSIVHAEFLGDVEADFDTAKADYKKHILKFHGKTKGEKIYAEGEIAGAEWEARLPDFYNEVARESGIKIGPDEGELLYSTTIRYSEEAPAGETVDLQDPYSEDRLKVDDKKVLKDRGDQFDEEFQQPDPENDPDWKRDNLNLLRLPELVRLAEKLMQGQLPQVVLKFRKATTRGMFIPGHPEMMKIRADLFKDPAQAKLVLAHEIGHLIDWLPSKEMGRGNILGRIATLRRYLKRTLPHHPGAPGELTEEDRRRLRLEAKRLLEAGKGRTKLIDEMITKELPITPDDVLAIWNAIEKAKLLSPKLYAYIATLNTAAKKLLVKAALKGRVPSEVQRFAKKIQEPTGRKIEVPEELPEKTIAEKYARLVEEEIRRRQLWVATEIREELIRLTHLWKPFDAAADPKYTAYRYSSNELYADALSVLLNSPQMLRRMAPKFYEAFFSWLDTKPEFRDEYNEIQYLIRSGEIDRERTMSIYRMFDDGNDKYYELMKKDWDRSNFWDNLKRDTFDAYHYLLKDIKRVGEGQISPEDNPRYKVENMVYSGSEIEGMLTMVMNNVLKPLKEANLEWDREFGLLAFLERIVFERYAMANPEGWDAETALEKINAMKDEELTEYQWGKLREALDNFRAIHKQYFLDKAEAAQVYDTELVKLFREREQYVSFSAKDYFMDRYGTAAGMRVFQQIGTFKKIFNPATATILKDISFIHSVNRNIAIKSIVKFYLEHQEALPDVKIEPAKKKWNGRFQAIQEPTRKDQGLLVYLDKGKACGYYINRELADMFTQNPYHSSAIAKGLSVLAKPFRMVFTEINYGFWVFNAFFRDLQRAYMSLPKAGVLSFTKNYLKGIKPAFRSVFGIPDDVIKEMQDGNMLISIADVRGLLPEDKQIERLLKMHHMMPGKAYDTKILRPFGHLFNYVSNIAKVGEYYFAGVGRALERTTKVASYTYMKDKFPDMPQDAIAHIVRTRGGSPDFLRSGRAHSIYNNLLLFSNAMKEGYRGDVVAMKEDPKAWWMKKMAFIFVPKLLMAAILWGFLDGDDEESKLSRVMRGVSTYDFLNYICIPLGLTKSGKSVYLRIPTDETSRFLGGVFSLLLRGKDFGFADAALKLGDYMAGQAPTWNPAIDVVAAIVEYAGGNNPYDNFYGRHAVDEQVFLARDARSHKQFGMYLLNKMGASIVYRFRYDEVEKVAEELETVLGFPINSKVADWMIKLPDEPGASNIIGRFLKVSDYGKREEIRRGKKEIQRENARTLLDAKEGVAKLVNEEPLEQKHFVAMALKPDAVDRNMLVALSRRYGWMYYEEYMAARSKQEKWYVLSKMIADSVIPATTYGPIREQPPESGEIPSTYFRFEEEE